MKKIFFFLAALMLTFTAHATIVECNPGTNNLAWYLTQGDTLVLADGLYEEAYSIDFTKPGVCVKAAEGAKPVIKLTGEWTVLDVQATTTFDGITFDAGNVAKYLIATTGVNPGTLTINNCEFCNWTYWALSNQFEETASIDSVIINNTLFHDGAEAAISFNNKAPEGTHSCNYFSLTNSTIYNVVSTEYAGIVHVSSNGEATGMQNTIIIDHVTMYNLDGADLGIIAARKTSDLTISNTIIANPAEGERASYVYGGVAENVIYYNVSQDGDLTYTNCLTDDPKFVDAANGNFALAEGSPALTAGTDGKAIGDPRWNVVVEPEPVVYNVTVTAENGTVEGAGEFEEGAEVTLTATPAEGYEFVNWTKDEEVVSTENPYTFTVTADVALVANFELIPVVEPEKPEPTYTENNLNPYAFGLESKLSDDKTTLTVTYRLNNSNATSVNVIVYNGDEVVATVPGTTTIGKNTVEVPTADLPGGVKLTWAVEVNGTSVAAPTAETKIYSFFHPSSVDVDNNPENPTFGMLLVNEAMQSVASKTSGYVSAGFGAGIFAFTPSFDLIPNGELPGYNGGKTFSTATNDFAPRRIRISKDGRIFATAQDGSGEYLWEINPDNMNEWTTVFQGTNEGYSLKDAEGNFIAGTNSGFDVRGEGENLQLLMLSSSLPGAQVGSFKCHTYDLGTATTWATAPTKEIPGANYMLVTNQSNAQFDKDGGVWYIQYRGTTTDKEPGLVHINKDGVEDLKVLRNYARNAGFRFTPDFSKVVIAGTTAGTANPKKATVYAVSADENGVPVLTEEVVIDMANVGNNLNDFAWDYAGNLYACGNSSEKLAAWAMPYSGKVSTPAAAKYAFQLEAAVVEPVELVGVVKRALTIGESTVVLTHEANGTPHIYNIVGEEIAEVSLEGVVPVNPDNLGDYLAISDIAVTEDGKLVARNYMRVTNLNYALDAGYERGENRFYIWNDLAGAPSVWFTSLMTSNSIRSDQGITMAVKGTSTNAKVLTTGVHNSGRGIRLSLFFIKDGKYVDPNGGAGNKSEYYWYLDSHYKSDAIYNEAAYGVLPELSASPLGENNWIMDNVGMAPSEFSEPADGGGDPIVNTVLADDVVGKKFNGATYVTIDDQVLMVAPYATAEGLLAGVKVLDITAGLASATEVAVADLDAAVEATAAATAVVVDEDKLIITLVGDATLYTLTAELTQDPGPGTALDNVAVEAKAIKMIKNGQLIIIKNGVQYNVQGQVIK